MRHPFDKTAYILPVQGLFGDDGGTGALDKFAL